MTADFPTWRAGLRATSGLVMLSFVICHLTAHSMLLVSFEDAEATRTILMYPWRTVIGTAILTTAFVVHFSNALWSVYIRRSLQFSAGN
jgi:adenylate cyclase